MNCEKLQPSNRPDGLNLANALARASMSSADSDESELDIYSAIRPLLMDPVFLSLDNLATEKWDRTHPLLGDGTDFEVRQMTKNIHGMQTAVAIKRLKHAMPRPGNTYQSHLDSSQMRPFLRDLYVMRAMRHCPNVVDLLDTDIAINENGQYVIPILTVELAVHGTLSDFLAIKTLALNNKLQMRDTISEALQNRCYATRKSLVAQVASGLFSLHTAHIFHMDIKPKNVLVFYAPECEFGVRAKLSDFAFALIQDPKKPLPRFALGVGGYGTPGYTAPELRGRQKNDILQLSDLELQKADIYSFGILMVESLTSCSMVGDAFIEDLCTFLKSEGQDFIPSEDATRIMLLLEKCLAPVMTRFESCIHILVGLRVSVPEATKLPSDVSNTINDEFAGGISMSVALSLLEDHFMNGGIFTNGGQILRNQMIRSPMRFNGFVQFVLGFLSANLNLISILNWWSEFIATLEEGSHVKLMLTAFNYGGEADWNSRKCCWRLLEAAKRRYMPAKVIYRRIHEALLSVPLNEECPDLAPHPPVDALEEVDKGIFDVLESLGREYPDDYLAKLIAFYLRTFWSCAIKKRLAEKRSEFLQFMSPGIDACTPENVSMCRSLIQEGIEAMTTTGSSLAEAQQDYGDLLAGAIMFDDQQSMLLDLACSKWRELGLSLAFHIKLTADKDISPLTLACVLGKAGSVRTLCKHDSDSSMNRLQSLDGDLPLHYLFVFTDNELNDMFSLLSVNVDLSSQLLADGDGPEGHLCFLCGSPLDFALQAGNSQAVAILWASFRRSPHFLYDNSLNHIPGLFQADALVLDMLKCFASCSLSIWDIFVSELSHDDIMRLKAQAGSLLSGAPVGLCYLSAFIAALSVNKVTHMLLHGPNYFEKLVLQITNSIPFLVKVCGTPLEDSWLYSTFVTFRDPDINLALFLSTTRLTSPQLLVEPVNPFVFAIAAMTPQYSWLSHNIGFALPEKYEPYVALFHLKGATRANNMPAIRRILNRTRIDGHCLRDAGIIDFIIHGCAEECLPGVMECITMIEQLDLPPAHSWSPWTNLSNQASEEKAMLEAIKHQNVQLVLLLFKTRHGSYRSSYIFPGLLQMLCTNDRNAVMLRRVLEMLDPEECLRLITERTNYSLLTPLDIALLSASGMCLNILGEFLNSTPQQGGKTEKILDLTTAMLRASVDVQLGTETFEILQRFIKSLRNPFLFPLAILQASRELDEIPNLGRNQQQLFLLVKFASLVGCNEIRGVGDVEDIYNMILPYLPTDIPEFETWINYKENHEADQHVQILRYFSVIGKARRYWRLSLVYICVLGAYSLTFLLLTLISLCRGVRYLSSYY